MPSFAEVVAGVRATIAAYTHALDDGRTDDVVATFCPDGVFESPGLGSHRGRDALRTAYTQWEPRRPQRHVVVNTHVTDWSEDRARAVSDVIFLSKGEAGWTVQRVGRYDDTLHHIDGAWLFDHRVATFTT